MFRESWGWIFCSASTSSSIFRLVRYLPFVTRNCSHCPHKRTPISCLGFHLGNDVSQRQMCHANVCMSFKSLQSGFQRNIVKGGGNNSLCQMLKTILLSYTLGRSTRWLLHERAMLCSNVVSRGQTWIAVIHSRVRAGSDAATLRKALHTVPLIWSRMTEPLSATRCSHLAPNISARAEICRGRSISPDELRHSCDLEQGPVRVLVFMSDESWTQASPQAFQTPSQHNTYTRGSLQQRVSTSQW